MAAMNGAAGQPAAAAAVHIIIPPPTDTQDEKHERKRRCAAGGICCMVVVAIVIGFSAYFGGRSSGSTQLTATAAAVTPSALPAAPSQTVSPSPSVTISSSVSPSLSMTLSSSASPSPSVTMSSSISPTVTITASVTPSATQSSTVTPSTAASGSVTQSPTTTMSVTASTIATSSVSPSITGSSSGTASLTATGSLSASMTPSASLTSSFSVSASLTASVTGSSSSAASTSSTASVTATASVSPTTGAQLAGVVVTIAGSFTGVIGSVDGIGTAASFSYPYDIASDGAGNAYISDFTNQCIRKLVLATNAVTTWAGSTAQVRGTTDGVGTNARFSGPYGITFDGAGSLFVTDYYNCVIRKIDIATVTVSSVAGGGATGSRAGNANGVGTAALFGFPIGIVSDRAGTLYVSDYNNSAIRKVVVSTATVTTLAGGAGVLPAGYVDAVGTAAKFNFPYGIALSAGFLYVADMYNHNIRRVDVSSGAVTTFAGGGGSVPAASGYVDATGTSARFNYPGAVTVDSLGYLYVADSSNNIVRQIRLSTGAVTTLAGRLASGTADGTRTNAQFNSPYGMAAFDGKLYVVDSYNHKLRVVT